MSSKVDGKERGKERGKGRALRRSLCLAGAIVLAACQSAPPDPSRSPQVPGHVIANASPPPASVPNVPLPESQPAPLVKRQAMQALARMGEYLRTLKAFEIEAFTSTDEVVEHGLKVQLEGRVSMQVRRPNRLHMLVTSDRKQREIFFDGRQFALVAPRLKYYAVSPAPATLGELFDTLSAQEIEMPLGDMFMWGTERSPQEDVRLAVPLGPEMIDGTLTDHYLISREDVSWQVWIQRGEQPLPRKLVITTLTEPQQPQHVALMRWNLSPRLDDQRFSYAPTDDAIRIPLRGPIEPGSVR